MTIRAILSAIIHSLWVFSLGTAVQAASIHLGGEHLESITVVKQALYPEGLEYDPVADRFLLGSVRGGAVYQIAADGTHRLLVEDERLKSVVGVRVDATRNRLLVANSDYGASVRHHPGGPMKLASLGIYDLSTGESLAYADLSALQPEGKHFANDLTIDDDGNAYVTDSVASTIFKVDAAGRASVLLQHERFAGKGFGLNGIAFHPGGYLLVAKKNEGALFKIPLTEPEAFTQVAIPESLVGADGLVLAGEKDLVVITNRASGIVANTAFALTSDDDWDSARIVDRHEFDDVYPTTGTVRNGKLYVVHSRLNTLLDTLKAKQPLAQLATIAQIGVVRKSVD